MKLILQNFKCWKEKSITFPDDEGITLISGKSGIGKSSLLEAIYFVLFGIGNKIILNGEKSCQVEFEILDLKIKRSKRPNLLIVNDKYEDKIGQQIIDDKFGASFGITSFLRQNSLNSFILLGPMDKLAFLEKLIFEDIDINSYKKNIKSLIKDRETELIKTQTELNLSHKVVDVTKKPNLVKFPIICKPKDYDLAIKNENIKYRNYKIKKKRLERKLEKLVLYSKEIEIFESNNKIRNNEVKKLTLEKEEIELFFENNKNFDAKIYYRIDLESQLKKLINQRELNLLKQKYKEDGEKLEKLKQGEILEKNLKIKDIEKKLWKEYSKEEILCDISNLKESLIDFQNYEKYLKKIEKINTNNFDKDYIKLIEVIDIQLENNIKLLEKIKLKEKTYHCPSCNIKLKFDEDCLSVTCEDDFDENLSKKGIRDKIEKNRKNKKDLEMQFEKQKINQEKIDFLKKEITEIKDKYNEISESKNIKDDLIFFENYYQENIILEIELKEVQKEDFSHTINEFVEYQTNLKKQIDNGDKENINKGIDDGMNEDELRVEINKLLKLETEYNLNLRNNEDIEGKIQLFSEEIKIEEEKIRNNFSIKNIDNLKTVNNSIDDLNKIINEYNENLIIIMKNLKDIKAYNEYKDKLNDYTEIIDNNKNLQENEKLIREKLTNINLLKEKINETEAITIFNIIETINKHAQIYLDIFFDENPINISLMPYKEDKKKNKKPQVNVQIEYKGMECDLNTLSGGEIQRTVIAFTLALSEIFNSPLLLLDECTSNLDQELTNLIIQGIKENYSGKNIILIAHQVVAGIFDNVINLE